MQCSMVTIPMPALWSVRTLDDAARDSVLSFLSCEPLMNIYLISRILDEGIGGSGGMIEVRHGRERIAVSSLGSNVVAAVTPGASDEERWHALRLVAERLLMQGIVLRAIICEASTVETLWRHIAPRSSAPTVVRLNQPVYVLEGDGEDLPPLETVRHSVVGDLDRLVPACAAMHLEEVGIDPLARDAWGYRERIRELVLAGRSLVLVVDGEIAFKCEYSAVTPGAVQLMGVWTAPHLRRHGWAREGMREVCGHILRQGRKVTLFVNDFNLPAVALYESLGFRRIGCNRALIW
jgi:uncharacterized protein